MGQRLTAAWGRQIIVENRSGGGTNIGTEIARWAQVIKDAKIPLQ